MYENFAIFFIFPLVRSSLDLTFLVFFFFLVVPKNVDDDDDPARASDKRLGAFSVWLFTLISNKLPRSIDF